MPRRLTQLVLLTTVVFTVSMSSARAQDATASGTRSFSAGAFFIGIFNAESDGEVSAMAGVFGYVARRRVLLGVQGGFLGSYVPAGVYGLANVGYFLRVRNGHQVYALGGFGVITVPTRSLLFNVGGGLDFLVFPKVGKPRQEGYVFGARVGSLITPSKGGGLAGVYVQLAIFGGGRRAR